MGIFPPINVLPSLSRLMKSAIGAGMTRPDHFVVSNHIYASNARGKDVMDMETVVGKRTEGHLYLAFLEQLEGKFVAQGPYEARTIFESVDLACSILRVFPKEFLKKIYKKTLNKSWRRAGQCKGWRCSPTWRGRASQR